MSTTAEEVQKISLKKNYNEGTVVNEDTSLTTVPSGDEAWEKRG